MAVRLSRRKITGYVASQLVDGCDKDYLIKQLASFLVNSKRVKETELAIRDIELELSKRGIVLANITSAFELSESTKSAISELVTNTTGANNIQLCQYVDSDVIGGIKLDIPGMQFDGTIARKLITLKTSSKE